MTWFLWSILLVLLVGMMLPSVRDGRQRIQFPFLAAVAVSYHVLLPLYVLIRRGETLEVPGLDRVILMAILCLGCAWAGYQYRWRTTLFHGWEFDEGRLAIGAACLSFFGIFAVFGMGRIQLEATADGRMTGLGTVLLFFSNAARFGFVIAALLYIRSRKKWLWLLMLPQLWIYLQQLNVARRTPMGELAVSVLLLLFFARRWTPPLWFILVGVSLAAVYHFSVGTLRATIGLPIGERIRVLMESSPLDALQASGVEEKAGFSVELNNAVGFMEAKARSGNFTYGRHFWNQLVFGWVPGQFLGSAFKESLKFDLPDDAAWAGFEKPTGTCESGIAEAYMAFWFFGALLFFVMGSWLRFLWDSAEAGSLIHQAFLALSLFSACMTFSSQIWSYVNYVSQVLAFTMPIFYWARLSPSPESSFGESPGTETEPGETWSDEKPEKLPS